jgi:hypothetical protein
VRGQSNQVLKRTAASTGGSSVRWSRGRLTLIVMGTATGREVERSDLATWPRGVTRRSPQRQRTLGSLEWCLSRKGIFMRDQCASWSRRQFVGGLTLAGTAALLGLRPEEAAAEPPPETPRLRLYKFPGICLAPQYVAEGLLRAEGFTDVQ